MENLKLTTTQNFGNVETDIYEDNNNEMYMTTKQLSECLGYAGKNGLKMLISRNPYLKSDEFSRVVLICNPLDNNMAGQETRVFNEDGIYEVSFLASTEKAKEFRAWIRKIFKMLRQGKMQLSNNGISFSPELFDKAIQKYLPHPNTYNENTWNKNIAQPLILSVARITGLESRDALDLIYDTMTSKYGFYRNCARNEYCAKYHIDDVTVINAIADNPIYKQDFALAVNSIIEDFSIATNHKCVVDKIDDMDDFDKVVYPLAVKLNDNSCRHAKTLHLIYDNMKSKQGWKVMRTRYHQTTNKGVIMRNSKLFSEMRKTIKNLMEG